MLPSGVGRGRHHRTNAQPSRHADPESAEPVRHPTAQGLGSLARTPARPPGATRRHLPGGATPSPPRVFGFVSATRAAMPQEGGLGSRSGRVLSPPSWGGGSRPGGSVGDRAHRAPIHPAASVHPVWPCRPARPDANRRVPATRPRRSPGHLSRVAAERVSCSFYPPPSHGPRDIPGRKEYPAHHRPWCGRGRSGWFLGSNQCACSGDPVWVCSGCAGLCRP